jgi:carboxymethylenebutenolidase
MSDIEGLAHQVDPLSRRGFFLAASAATAAGYTLAAGPVRADAIHTDSAGLTAGEAKVKVSDGEMPVYYARPANAQNPPVILVAMEIFGLHEYIKDVTRRLGKLGAFAIAPDYYFRKGVDLTKITEIPQLMPIVNKSRTPNCSPTSMRRWRGRSLRAAIAAVAASWASAAAGERCGNTPRITRT